MRLGIFEWPLMYLAHSLCQGAFAQCRIAHRYPPGGFLPIPNCVTCVMHFAGMGVCTSIRAFSLHHAHNANFETFEMPCDHSRAKNHEFGYICPSSAFVRVSLPSIELLTGNHQGFLSDFKLRYVCDASAGMDVH